MDTVVETKDTKKQCKSIQRNSNFGKINLYFLTDKIFKFTLSRKNGYTIS